MKEKGLFFWKESKVNGKSYFQLWYRGNPDKFVCTENKLVKLLEASACLSAQTKKNPEKLTKSQEAELEVLD
jgi:phenolic acid decarboxylase